MTRSEATDADAAFFEDWSEWACLDGLPCPATNAAGHVIINGARRTAAYTRHYCILRYHSDVIGGPAFELHIPTIIPCAGLLRRIDGWRQMPGLHGPRRVSNARADGLYLIPAHQWRALRAALPDLKRIITARVQTDASDEANRP